jgi:putative ABC transport system permease protein
MIWQHTLKTALRGLKTHKSRSLLTILGIVIGITSIILIMSLGRGAQDLILSQIQGMGSLTIAIVPGREATSPTDVAQTLSDSLKDRDLKLLQNKANAPDVKEIIPIVFGAETATYKSETYRLTIFGSGASMISVFDLHPSEGESFSEEDVRTRAEVVVIGSKVKEKLFGTDNAIGQKIRLKGRNFRVIAVLPQQGQSSFVNFDEVAIVPYTTAQQYLFGIKYFNRLIAQATSEKYIDQAVSQIKQTLRDSHNITDPAKDDFNVQSQADIAKRIKSVTTVLTLFLTAVAAISLMVGGVGIMNIMLVSVTERTREIGLRKALGATNKNIMYQFLTEAVTLTVIGGAVGILLGSVFSLIASILIIKFGGLDWSFTFPWGAAILGIGVSAVVGLVFGIYPARQASLKSPMEALRYE